MVRKKAKSDTGNERQAQAPDQQDAWANKQIGRSTWQPEQPSFGSIL